MISIKSELTNSKEAIYDNFDNIWGIIYEEKVSYGVFDIVETELKVKPYSTIHISEIHAIIHNIYNELEENIK
jgi:hypothetical protein